MTFSFLSLSWCVWSARPTVKHQIYTNNYCPDPLHPCESIKRKTLCVLVGLTYHYCCQTDVMVMEMIMVLVWCWIDGKLLLCSLWFIESHRYMWLWRWRLNCVQKMHIIDFNHQYSNHPISFQKRQELTRPSPFLAGLNQHPTYH